MSLTPASPYCQRWKEGQHSWRHKSEGGFDKSKYEVALIEADNPAKRFVTQHHYSGSYVAALRRVGLYQADQLVGVAVFSQSHRKVLTASFPQLEPYKESMELGRFVLLDEVPANAETWFLAHSFKLLAPLGVKGIVSFADPLPRVDEHGRKVSPGHVGTIYQASNAFHANERSTARTLLIGRDGRTVNARALQKIRRQDQGHEYAEKQLIALGARIPKAGEDMTAWLRDALIDAGFRRVRHPGNYRYLFQVGSKADRSRAVFGMNPAPYPKEALR